MKLEKVDFRLMINGSDTHALCLFYMWDCGLMKLTELEARKLRDKIFKCYPESTSGKCPWNILEGEKYNYKTQVFNS